MVDLGKLAYIFLQGFLAGAGPCTLICAPIVIPYIAGTQKTWQGGLRAVLIFNLTRLFVYTVLGGVVGYLGYYLFCLLQSRIWEKIIWSCAGIFIIALGILMMIGKEFKNPLCSLLQKKESNMILLGLVVGVSPCLPLLGVLTEIMFIADKFYQGWLLGLAFGLGTLISPLLVLGTLAPLVPLKTQRLNFVCGLLLVLAGLSLFLSLR